MTTLCGHHDHSEPASEPAKEPANYRGGGGEFRFEGTLNPEPPPPDATAQPQAHVGIARVANLLADASRQAKSPGWRAQDLLTNRKAREFCEHWASADPELTRDQVDKAIGDAIVANTGQLPNWPQYLSSFLQKARASAVTPQREGEATPEQLANFARRIGQA